MKTGFKVTFIIFPFDFTVGPISFDGAIKYRLGLGLGYIHMIV